MGNLSTRPSTSRHGVIEAKQSTVNLAGGQGFVRDAKGELFILGVSLLYGEPTFYEAGDTRAQRWRDLVAKVTKEDADWVARFLPWLRGTANIRTASLVGAVEYALAGGPNPRSVIRSVIQRADEPAEVLAYFRHRTGKNPSGGVARGIADGAVEKYDQHSVLKYGGKSRAWQPADVISLTRPRPRDQQQSDLFNYLRHRRWGKDFPLPESLDMISFRNQLAETGRQEFRDAFHSMPVTEVAGWLRRAGMTWEQASGLYGELDAAFWSAMIPSMGIFAILRNLNNFDRAEVPTEIRTQVIDRLIDPVQIAKSRLFPYRFYTAYRERLTDNFAHALSAAMDLSVSNIPHLPGRTLILVDSSGSMGGALFGRGFGKSKITPAEIATLFGAALVKRNPSADFVLFDNKTEVVKVRPGTSILRTMAEVSSKMMGGATYTWAALQEHFNDHDRVIILTDMATQMAFSGIGGGAHWQTVSPRDVKAPVYSFNLNGYGAAHTSSGENFVEFGGGFSDTAFRAIPLLEQGRKQDWPF